MKSILHWLIQINMIIYDFGMSGPFKFVFLSFSIIYLLFFPSTWLRRQWWVFCTLVIFNPGICVESTSLLFFFYLIGIFLHNITRLLMDIVFTFGIFNNLHLYGVTVWLMCWSFYLWFFILPFIRLGNFLFRVFIMNSVF